MTEQNKIIIKATMEYCDDNNKSTPFMLQMMCDKTRLGMDEIVNYLFELSQKEKKL